MPSGAPSSGLESAPDVPLGKLTQIVDMVEAANRDLAAALPPGDLVRQVGDSTRALIAPPQRDLDEADAQCGISGLVQYLK